MRRAGSKIAGEIVKDYKIEQAYKRKTRSKCKEKNCNKCKWYQICIDKDIKK